MSGALGDELLLVARRLRVIELAHHVERDEVVRGAMDDDLRADILSQELIDPIACVKAIEPPHAHAVALALAVRA